MNSLKDISITSKKKQIDIRDPQRITSPKVLTGPKKITRDISKGLGKNINLRKHSKIQISQKSGKNFDSLEQIGKKRKKDIILKSNKNIISLTYYFALAARRVKKLGLLGVVYFLIVLFPIVLGLLYIDKIIIENRVNAGYEKLMSLKDGGKDVNEIKKLVNNARFDLLVADTLFTPFRLIPGEKIESISHVISGGRYITKSLDDILALYSYTDNYIQQKDIRSIYFTEYLTNIEPNLLSIENTMKKSVSHYESIEWLPSDDLLMQKNLGVESLKELLSYLSVINNDFESLKSLLGHEERKKYLIVFQNADEIRPTGGFMGSMGLLEIFRGRVQLFQKKDVYAIEWDLKSADYERLAPPKGINTLTDTFGLRDANYFINIEDSSNTINFFTERAGLDLDGVVYVNQGSLLRLLDVTGPINSRSLGREINSDNFSELMSLIVESKISKVGTLGTPKQALFDFIEEYSQKLISDGDYFEYLKVLIHELKSREILFWSFNSGDRKVLTDMNLIGKIDYDKTLDFAYPVYTSISGNKSDRYMKRLYTQTVRKYGQCGYQVDFTIKSTHDMGKLKRDRIQSLISEFELESPNLYEIQGASTNKQFMRIIFPHEAIISPKDGMEIVDYGSRKGVEFFLNTELQQSSFYTISYSLPNLNCLPYTYNLYKQAGIKDYDIYMNIDGENYEYRGREEDFYFEKR